MKRLRRALIAGPLTVAAVFAISIVNGIDATAASPAQIEVSHHTAYVASAIGVRPAEPVPNCGDSIRFINTKRSGNTLTTTLVAAGLDAYLPPWSETGELYIYWKIGGTSMAKVDGPFYPDRKKGLVRTFSVNTTGRSVMAHVVLFTEERIVEVCSEDHNF